MIFPRYHQLQAVRQMVAAAAARAWHNYLVEHSAGSGKSNTIAWLAHRLASLHNERTSAVFDSVVVITDRVVLDRSCRTPSTSSTTAGRGAEDRRGFAPAGRGAGNGVPIIITTLQKFPFRHGQLMKLAEERGEGSSHCPRASTR
jgi:type I restriction enzyme, R subunit